MSERQRLIDEGLLVPGDEMLGLSYRIAGESIERRAFLPLDDAARGVIAREVEPNAARTHRREERYP